VLQEHPEPKFRFSSRNLELILGSSIIKAPRPRPPGWSESDDVLLPATPTTWPLSIAAPAVRRQPTPPPPPERSLSRPKAPTPPRMPGLCRRALTPDPSHAESESCRVRVTPNPSHAGSVRRRDHASGYAAPRAALGCETLSSARADFKAPRGTGSARRCGVGAAGCYRHVAAVAAEGAVSCLAYGRRPLLNAGRALW
jgi:hypothetical protein